MTQAFNLSQLANNLNSAGQLDATDGLVNAVPVANGGTGVTNLSGVAFGNGTSGFTAATNAQMRSALGTLTVGGGGTGVTTLTGIAYGNGTGAFTAASAAQIVSAIGSTAVTNATNATTAASCSGNSATVTNGVYTTNFTGTNQSLVTNGYQKLPGGVIIQWGSAPWNTTVSFPITFPNAVWSVTFGSQGADGIPRLSALTTSSFFYDSARSTGTNAYWIAIGY